MGRPAARGRVEYEPAVERPISPFNARAAILNLLRARWWPDDAKATLGGYRAHAVDQAAGAVLELTERPLALYRELQPVETIDSGRLLAADPHYFPRLVPLRAALEGWATQWGLHSEPLLAIALQTIEIWSWYEEMLRRREWLLVTGYMAGGGPERRVQKPQTWDPYVWTVLSQVVGWRREKIAKWHNGWEDAPKHGHAKRKVSTDDVRRQVDRVLGLIELRARPHASGRPAGT